MLDKIDKRLLLEEDCFLDFLDLCLSLELFFFLETLITSDDDEDGAFFFIFFDCFFAISFIGTFSFLDFFLSFLGDF